MPDLIAAMAVWRARMITRVPPSASAGGSSAANVGLAPGATRAWNASLGGSPAVKKKTSHASPGFPAASSRTVK
jgi:hypothetical protein